jgi:two-component system sensor histidine kinase MprB
VTFRRRLALLTSVAVTVALAAGSVVTYLAVRNALSSEIDATLRERGDVVAVGGGTATALSTQGTVAAGPPTAVVSVSLPTQATGWVLQPLSPAGAAIGPALLPVSAADRAVARGASSPVIHDVEAATGSYRVITSATPFGAFMIARPLQEMSDLLARLALILVAVTVLGGIAAAFASRLVARAQVAPVARLTLLAEEVARTRDTAHRIAAGGADELGRLGAAFNAMLAALDDSLGRQRRLVADVSHELRTPLTSLRANVELLGRADELGPDETARVRADVLAQSDELAVLVGDLVEGAREDSSREQPSDVRLDEIVASEVERLRRDHPGLVITLAREPVLVVGAPRRIARAVRNLLGNAAKWSPAGGAIAVTVDADGAFTVRDHGPGIDQADLPFVFERFFRAASARSQPGTGLGLAIVRDVALEHGGTVALEPAAGGGTLARLVLPVASPA